MVEPPPPDFGAAPPPGAAALEGRGDRAQGEWAATAEFPPGSSKIFHRQLAAEPAAIQSALLALRRSLTRADCADAMARGELVLAEVLNNIAQHGTGRGKRDGDAPRAVGVHLTVIRHPGGIACAVSDDGPPLPRELLIGAGSAAGATIGNAWRQETGGPGHDGPARAMPRQATDTSTDEVDGGFGWDIIRALAHSLFYYRRGGRNVLCFNMPLPAAGTLSR